LLHACIEGNEPACEEFIRRFHPVIACTVMRCARRFRATTPELIDHLVQATLLKICANRCRILSEFGPRSPNAISAFVKAVAFSVTLDYFRIGMTENRRSGLSDAYAKSAVANSHGLPRPGPGLTQAVVKSGIQHLTSHVRARRRGRDLRPLCLDPPPGGPKSERAKGKSSPGTF
jgi:hypothetical protein